MSQAEQGGAASGAEIGALIRRGLLLRVLTAFAVHYLLGPFALAPDQETYDWVGSAIARYWTGESLIQTAFVQRKGDPVVYYYIVGAIYYVFGNWPMLPKLANCLVGTMMIPVVHSMALKVSADERIALRAARYAAYFPSLVLWSALNLRDIWTAYLILLVCYLAMSLQDAPTLRRLVMLGGAVYLLTEFRGYVFLPIAIPVVLSFVVRGRRRFGRNLLIGGLVGLAVIYVDSASGSQRKLRLPDLEMFQEYRFFTSLGAQQYEATADISTPLNALLFLPKGVVFFLMAPFPWEVRNAVQAATVPEMLFLYSLLPAMFVGLKHLLKARLSDALMPVLITAALTFGYALAQSNVGTAYRHRAQVLPFYLILAATGVELRRRQHDVVVSTPALGMRAT